jgi:hypothetical protein
LAQRTIAPDRGNARRRRWRSRRALVMVTARLVAFAAASGVAAIAPAAAHAQAPGTILGAGTVTNYPNYSWQAVQYAGPPGTVVYVWDNTNPILGPGGTEAMWEYTVGEAGWYQFTNVSNGTGGYQTMLATPSSAPAFLNPDADSESYALFTSAMLNAISPAPLPVFPAPPSTPPTLQADPDPDAPGAPDEPDPSTTPPPDPGAGGSSDPGAGDAGGGGDPDPGDPTDPGDGGDNPGHHEDIED